MKKQYMNLYEKLPAGNDSLPCKYGGSGTGLLSRRYGTIENKTTMVSFTECCRYAIR